MPSFEKGSLSESCIRQPDFTIKSHIGDALPIAQGVQLAYHKDPLIDNSFLNLSHLQQSRSHIYLSSIPCRMETEMFGEEYRAADLQLSPQISSLAVWSSGSPDSSVDMVYSPQLSLGYDINQCYPVPLWQHNLPDFRQSDIVQQSPSGNDAHFDDVDNDEEEEATYDKPYAQLIYDALKQAPGHRMLLRDIYEWFILNTRKPRESGTNGWQNSIRHNLSMNQVSCLRAHLFA